MILPPQPSPSASFLLRLQRFPVFPPRKPGQTLWRSFLLFVFKGPLCPGGTFRLKTFSPVLPVSHPFLFFLSCILSFVVGYFISCCGSGLFTGCRVKPFFLFLDSLSPPFFSGTSGFPVFVDFGGRFAFLSDGLS